MSTFRKILILHNLIFYAAIVVVLFMADVDHPSSGLGYGLVVAALFFGTSLIALFHLIFAITKKNFNKLNLILIFTASPIPIVVFMEILEQFF